MGGGNMNKNAVFFGFLAVFHYANATKHLPELEAHSKRNQESIAKACAIMGLPLKKLRQETHANAMKALGSQSYHTPLDVAAAEAQELLARANGFFESFF